MDRLEFSFDRSVAAEDLHRLMLQSDWGHERTVDGLGTMLSQSTIRLGVWDGERLVGFARAISDGVYRSVIEDVIVDEEYRGKGIGAKIMGILIGRLSDVEHIYLFTSTDLEGYYKRFGFSITPYLSMRLLPSEQIKSY